MKADQQMASLSFVNMPGLVGLMAESKKGLFEVYLDKDDNTHFYHNRLKVAGLPLVGNERTGKRYKLSDCYKKTVSDEIFLYYATLNLEATCKNWNGSGPKVEKYWQKIKKHLKTN